MLVAKVVDLDGNVQDELNVPHEQALFLFVWGDWDSTFTRRDARDLWSEAMNGGGGECEIRFPYSVTLEEPETPEAEEGWKADLLSKMEAYDA